MEDKKLIKRHIQVTGNGSAEEKIRDVLHEEYRAFVRVAEVLTVSGIQQLNVETPLGDFTFRNDKGRDLKVDNKG